MSSIVVVVVPPVSEDDHAAWGAIEGFVGEQGPRAAVLEELHERLTARHPCVCDLPDDLVDDGVWSDGPLINDFGHRAAVLGISTSRFDEVRPFLVETANGLGLVVFDHATGLVHRPKADAAGGSLRALARRVVGGYSSLWSRGRPDDGRRT